MGKIAVIRLKGKFAIPLKVKKTLSCLKLERLFACTLLNEDASTKGMLQIAKDNISYGPIDEKAIALLFQKRGRTLDGKKLSDSKKPKEIENIASEYFAGDKDLSEFGLHKVFFLSPPKGGFKGKRKKSVPKGPMGKNAGISSLIAIMA